VLGKKFNQCSNSVKNATTMCIKCMQNLAIMDEEFQALVDDVEH
jgi:hypothetical protein